MSRDAKTEALMRQFVTDGPKGNSKEYQDGWERIFGKKPECGDECCPEHGTCGCDPGDESCPRSPYHPHEFECAGACELCGNSGRLADAPCPRGCVSVDSSDPR